MYCLIYILLSWVSLGKSTIYTANLFAGDVVDLGSYTTSVAIGKGPSPRHHQPLREVDKKAISNAHNLINKLRSKFSTGVPPLPPLDPYIRRNFPSIDLDRRNLPFSGKIIINKIRVIGAKQFYLNSIEIRVNNLRTDFDITIPELNANVTFDADVQLGGILPVTAKGKVRITITGIKVRGIVWATEIPQSTSKVYSVEGLRINFHADNIKIQLIKTSLRKFELQMLSSSNSPVSKKELTSMIGTIENNFVREIVKETNNILKKLTVTQIKQYLLTK